MPKFPEFYQDCCPWKSWGHKPAAADTPSDTKELGHLYKMDLVAGNTFRNFILSDPPIYQFYLFFFF